MDDLVDSGTTARVVRGLLPKAHFACVYAKPAGRPVVDSFVTEVSQDTWILFPWDTEPQFIEPLARRGGRVEEGRGFARTPPRADGPWNPRYKGFGEEGATELVATPE